MGAAQALHHLCTNLWLGRLPQKRSTSWNTWRDTVEGHPPKHYTQYLCSDGDQTLFQEAVYANRELYEKVEQWRKFRVLHQLVILVIQTARKFVEVVSSIIAITLLTRESTS